MNQKPNPPWKPFATAPEDGTENIDILAWGRTFGLSIATYHAERWDSAGHLGVWSLYPLVDEETVECTRDDLPDFWRHMPPGPGEEPANAKLLAACKAFLKKWNRQGLDANLQLEKFDVVARDMEIAIDDAEGSHE